MQRGRSEGGRGKWGKLEKAEKVSAIRLQCPDRSSIPHSLTESSSQLWQGRVTFSRRPPHASYWWPEALDVFIEAECRARVLSFTCACRCAIQDCILSHMLLSLEA